MPDDETYDLFVVHVDDRELEHLIETGLGVMVDHVNHRVVLPFADEMTAETVSRVMCGLMKREIA